MKKLIKENPEFRKVNKETARAAGILLGIEVDMEKRIEQEGEEIDMCTGLKEWFQEEREEGRKEGLKSLSDLFKLLRQDGRMDDLLQAIEDGEHRDRLLEEYSLI